MFRLPGLKKLVALVVLGPALPILVAAEKPEPPKPVLLLKAKECFVHAIPCASAMNDLERRNLPAGLQLLHTLSGTGEMRILATSGTRATIGPERYLRVRYTQVRVVGVASDAERLYVAMWTSPESENRPLSTEQAIKGGSYRLLVFWLADGSNLADLELTGKGLPDAAPKETTAKGPLVTDEKEVTCYGLTISLRGKQIANPTPKN